MTILMGVISGVIQGDTNLPPPPPPPPAPFLIELQDSAGTIELQSGAGSVELQSGA